MKSEEWITVTVEVPLSAIDFDDCGDGGTEVYGLENARLWFNQEPIEFKVHPDDVAKAEAEMHRILGTNEPATELTEEDKRALDDMAEYSRRLRQEQREQHSAMVLREREVEMGGILSNRRA